MHYVQLYTIITSCNVLAQVFSQFLFSRLTFTDENQRQLTDIPFEKRIKIALARVLSSYTREEFFEYGVEKTEELKLMTGTAQSMSEESGPGKFMSRRKLEADETNRHSRRISTISRRRQSTLNRSRHSSHTRRNSNDPQMRRRLSNEIQRNLRARPSNNVGLRRGARVEEEGRRQITNESEHSAPIAPVHTTVGEISLEGLDATISDLLGGIGEYSIEDVKGLFQQVDYDGSGYIDEDELNTFFDLLLNNDEDAEVIDKVERGMMRNVSTTSLASLGRRRSSSRRSSLASEEGEKAELLFGGDQAVEHLLELSRHPDSLLEDWSIFYCGGSARIESDLKATKKKYGIGDLAVERFNW